MQEFQIIKTKSVSPHSFGSGVTLHSLYDPKKEAEEFAASHRGERFIVLGMMHNTGRYSCCNP
jgi:hypothetical protein